MANFDLFARARKAMIDAGFEPDCSPTVEAEAARASSRSSVLTPELSDLRHLNWSSIDNTESRDLDQIEYAEPNGNAAVRLMVAIADVAEFVTIQSATDQRAQKNTTSVYTGPQTFPMLPRQLSEGETSLLENEDRVALVIDMQVATTGEIGMVKVFRALVRNKARLNYDEAGDFLEHNRASAKIIETSWLPEQLKLQAETAQRLMELRKRAGALTFSSFEPQVVKRNDEVVNLTLLARNRARDLIESFMIATNIATAAYLKTRGWPIVDRVVTVPKRWDRLREIARERGTELPAAPDQKALSSFLVRQRQADEQSYGDLSLAVVKLLGAGQYIIEYPDGPQQSHFGLALDDYSHSTAPNRRYADLLLQRLLRALLASLPVPYTKEELEMMAAHCTEREHAARKVERLMRKVCAALLLQPEIGQSFRGVITGASLKGTFVRLFDFPAEGKIVHGERGLDVGHKVEVRLRSTDPENGFIDFEVVRSQGSTPGATPRSRD
jgi:VacB/RNase II family 3'-5' exoribonuclease